MKSHQSFEDIIINENCSLVRTLGHFSSNQLLFRTYFKITPSYSSYSYRTYLAAQTLEDKHQQVDHETAVSLGIIREAGNSGLRHQCGLNWKRL